MELIRMKVNGDAFALVLVSTIHLASVFHDEHQRQAFPSRNWVLFRLSGRAMRGTVEGSREIIQKHLHDTRPCSGLAAVELPVEALGGWVDRARYGVRTLSRSLESAT